MNNINSSRDCGNCETVSIPMEEVIHGDKVFSIPKNYKGHSGVYLYNEVIQGRYKKINSI